MYWAFIFMLAPFGLAQQEEVLQMTSPEKIYLQLDGNVYTTDNVIWFKCIITDAMDHTPTAASTVVYVELIDPSENIRETKMVKITKGIGVGFFQLNEDYNHGDYLIRAYTEWNKNFGSAFIFQTYVRLLNSDRQPTAKIIEDIVIASGNHENQKLQASLDPLAIDSLHDKDLTTYVWLDKHKETFHIDKQKDGKYRLDMLIPDTCRTATIQFETENQYHYSKTILLKEGLDLQFFPESGRMVHGVPSKVAFKAVDFTGAGRRVNGFIINAKGQRITEFQSNELGMGTFLIGSPDIEAAYVARLFSSDKAQNFTTTYRLPEVAGNGHVLTVNARPDQISIICQTNHPSNEKLHLRVAARGVDYFEIKGQMISGTMRASISPRNLPEGIIAITMMDSSDRILAERLFFNEKLEDRIDIKLETDQDVYYQREPTVLDIQTTDNKGLPVAAHLSLLVLDKALKGRIQDLRDNILTYFLLNSELRGHVENPGFYFNDTTVDRATHLDALLLTQGWRKYNYANMDPQIVFPPETNLSVSGQIRGPVLSPNRKNLKLTLMTLGVPRTFLTDTADHAGRFYFKISDHFAENLNILFLVEDKHGRKRNHTITVDKRQKPPIIFDRSRSFDLMIPEVNEIVKSNLRHKKIKDAQLLDGSIIDLDEVVVKSYRLTPARKKVAARFGSPRTIIDGSMIQEKEADWSTGLFSVLKFNFRGLIEIRRWRNEFLYAQVIGGGPTLVVMDGIPVEFYEYPLIQNIPPSEVVSFEIISLAKNFADLYRQVFPEVPALAVPRIGSVVAIYTKSGQGIYGTRKPKGIFRTSIPTFSPSREFYAPKYQSAQQIDWSTPDLRSLIHWDPELVSDASGKTSTSFFNADKLGEMQIVVEAISGDGKIGYQAMTYQVTKSE